MIRLDRVVKTFRRQRVLDALSLDVDARDRIALIGSNGAGKTTLIRCLLGEYTYEGEISVFGASPRLDRRKVLEAIGFVPQLPPPLRLTVAELFRFAGTVSGTSTAAFDTIADRLGLDAGSVRSKPFLKLSGGQKQKVLLAIALGRHTKLLILDEPTANLDPAARRALFDVLAARGEHPMIISSHRLEEVAGLVNRVIELDQGRIVLDDRVEHAGDMGAVHACRIMIDREEAAFAKAMAQWHFRSSSDGREWNGEVAGPDRLRFLGMLSRYAGLIVSLSLSGEEATVVRPMRRAAE